MDGRGEEGREGRGKEKREGKGWFSKSPLYKILDPPSQHGSCCRKMVQAMSIKS